LTIIVPYGKKGSLNSRWDKSLIIYRQIDPANPPIPTINILIISIYLKIIIEPCLLGV